jgi:PAS domain S-box-containing protein
LFLAAAALLAVTGAVNRWWPVPLWLTDVLMCAVVAIAIAIARDRMVRLRRSESKLRALFESMDDLILILDRKGTYVEIAPTNEKLLFRPREQSLGRTVHDVLPKDVADLVVATIEQVLAERRTVEVDYWLAIGERGGWFTGKVSPLNSQHVIWVARDITARKLVEQELERAKSRSESLNQGIIEQVNEIIFTVDADGTITSLNPAFESIIGFPPEEWIGRDFLDLVPPKARNDVARSFTRIVSGEMLPLARVIVCGRDERRIVLEASLVQQVIDGQSAGFLGCARDITDRERAEENLRQSQRQLEDSQKIAKLGSWDHDLVHDRLVWSDQLYRIFGLDPAGEPITFERFIALLTPDEANHIYRMQAAALEGEADEWEVKIHAEGIDKLLICRARVARDTLGRPLRIFGTAQDITAARHAEQMLRESDERFQLLARATNDVMWDWNLETQATWWSEGLLTLVGCTPEEAADLSFWSERLHPDDRQRVLDAVNEAIDSGQSSWSSEYRLRRSDDSYADVLDRGYIVRAEDMVAVRMVGAMMDITDRKQMEERLAQANRVSSLGRIAASIAHEFNNVLMGVQPNLEVIRRRSSPELAVPIDHVLQSVRRGKRITEEILRFTRPAVPALQCVDVAEFLANWKLENASSLRQLALVMDIEPGIYVSADPLQIAQVLTNLAVNARDAVRDEGGSLTIAVRRVRSYGSLGFACVPTPDRFIHFAVTDDGHGMTKEQLAHLFEPLFTTKKGGTGLGLAVSYQIITRHDGYISAESTPGIGTTFHILLPETLPMFEVAPPARPDVPSNTRVLIVEDESAVSAGICALLELEGMHTCVVDTGAAAVPAAEEFHPDVVILDIGLPDMNGIDVYAGLSERWPRLPVVFSSGHAGASKLESYLTRSNVALMVKPYDLATLRGTLGTLLRVQ